MEKFARFKYMPPIPLGENGQRVTMCREHLTLAREAAAECVVLLKNEENILPIKNKKVAMFGVFGYHMIPGGGGSGMVNTKVKSLYHGLKAKESEGKISVYEPIAEKYNKLIAEALEKADPNYLTYVRAEAPKLTDAELSDAAECADIAIYSIGRRSGEGWDCRTDDSECTYNLTPEEKTDIDRICEKFDNVIILLNIGAVIDCEYFAENPKVKGIVCCWQIGSEGGDALADIFVGDKTPCGKLVDTIAKSYESYPSSADFGKSKEFLDYSEDIYVGYRYFETVPEKDKLVRYPFGFGLSYTSFEMSNILCGEENGYITAAVTVTNTGEYSGKEIIQIYYSAPSGILGKPKKQLIAFKKTSLLAPLESETLAIRFKASDMASFDDLGKIQKSAYVLEKGDYEFFISSSVRKGIKTDFVYHLDNDVITEQLTSYCRPWKLEKRMLSDGTYENLPCGEAVYEYDTHTSLGGTAGEEEVKFEKVGSEISLKDFIAQMTDDELINEVCGQSGFGIVNTCCFAGLDRLDIPKVATADGPAGLRIEPKCGIYTTAWPVATALACSWNTDLIYKIGVCGAREVKENNFGIWLTPALNIHRNVLGGRNFEYFSEDPLISGKMAAAEIKGIQSQKIAASAKHFCCNSTEEDRYISDSRVSERALREIYLKGFEICVKEADPWTVMTSYNLMNGIHTSESRDLISGILRGEWGFKGMVTSDWQCRGLHTKEVKAGNDMKMPYGYPEELKSALESGELTRADLEACVERTLNTYLKLV